MPIKPFEVSIPADTIADLQHRIRNTRWAPTIGEDDWQYGMHGGWLRDMAAYWADEYSWEAAQDEMNRYDHYLANTDGVRIHYMHVPAKQAGASPLVLTHGWPWTFWDFKDVVEPLSEHFDVYVPSLPGFGFSTPLAQSGVDVARIASLWVKLMTEELGFDKFAAHGGDWGALITAHLAHAHADKLIGAHMSLTLIPGVNRAELGPDAFAEDEQWMIERNAESQALITSHVQVHRLDPQTLAFALNDSPIGTAAWIWERRRNWSDCNGDVETRFSREHLCTTATLYWCTEAIGSSLRIYHEHFNKAWPLAHERSPTLEAPCAFAVFPKDVVHMPRSVLEKHANLVRYNVMAQGGHFAAAEEPGVLAEDVCGFFLGDLA